jgi:predicted ATP-binding protein involved in virulence
LSGGENRSRGLPEREVRFLTLFSESTALTQCEDWLTNLYSRSIDEFNADKERDKSDLETIRAVIDLLLPGTVKIARIDSQQVYFQTAGQAVVAIPELSDGYRSFLALTIDFLRHLTESGLNLQDLVVIEANEPRVEIHGVVLVDEIDSHLHPIWQRDIGFRLCKIFPKVQFIVSSHSPFIAQAATDGGLFVLRPIEPTGLVGVTQPVNNVRGWRVDQILTSDLFGLTETRDAETQQLLDRHQELVQRRTWAELTEQDKKELIRLEDRLSQRLTAPGESVNERTKQIEMARYVERTLENLGSRP